MRRHPFAALLALTIAGSAIAGLHAHAADALPGSDVHHRTVFENDHVRVDELLADAGAESPLRTRAPAVMVSLGKARFETTQADGTRSIVDFDPGQIAWVEGGERAWRLLSGQAHAFFVQPRSAADPQAPVVAPLRPDDSAAVDPVHHRVVMENDHVRVIDGMAAPGAESPRHSHPPSVLVGLSKSRFEVTIDGTSRLFDFEPARVYWIDVFEHEWTVLVGEARVAVVEIKSARATRSE